ncbi:isoleucine--tRNA ligase [Candidatus Pacearchaeota archaeon]|nr:isoleucine--tRNA ligase [Candidatus Pacearchaeota archaeon]
MIDFKKVEEEMWEFWEKNKIYEKLEEKNKKGEKFWLLDGPPYANGVPHIGHIKNTVFKDIVIRMNFMKGKSVMVKPGFDTHGLPVENMVEKKLGLQSKKDIETYGIPNFMKQCKDNAALNKNIWMRVYKKLGSLYCLKEPYLTYDDSYISSGWWTFNEAYKKGFAYWGEKPVMWCPHCQTSLSGYEITDSYKDVQDPGIYILFRIRNSDESLLVYTTTPWTLPGNVAIAIAPDENYVVADVAGRKIIIAEKRLEKLSELGFGYNILRIFRGEKLVGMKYEPLLDVPLQKSLDSGKLGRAHEIIASIPLLKERVASKMRTKKHIEGGDLFEEFVTMDDGTGLVHTAPGHGKTDFIVGQRYGLACVSPVDDECNLTKDSGFSGFVKKADKDILKRLEETGKLLYQETITHSYPLCWRCKSPLIFRLSNQLFLKIDKVKKIMKKENKKVNWMPEFARERFDNWVENAEDWNVSRQRYWGIPIPIWRCSNCGNEKVVSSKVELEKLTKRKISDLHNAGELTIQCGKCKKAMHKIKGVLDVWFDSGIAPWASIGYPDENKELFEKTFPVDRINEAQDQIRGWFYSLMFCSSAIFEKAPYKGVSMIGWVVDKKGEKMSKSIGNIIEGEEAVDTLGGDMLRYYFCWDVAPYEIQKFNLDIAKKEIGKILNVLWNLQNLANKNESEEEIEEKWLTSKLNNAIRIYQENIEKFESNTALRAISDFILNDLSRSYVQMTRGKENGKIILDSLIVLLKLLAPISPYITEKIWQNLKLMDLVQEESIHLTNWPVFNEKKIDKKLEESFADVMKYVELGLFERDKAKIGLKWPLAKAMITSDKKIDEEMKKIIAKQLNVKEIETREGNDIKIEIDTKATPELEAEGYAREFTRKVQAERKNKGLKKGELIVLKVSTDKKLKQTLVENIEFLKERTNSKKIEFFDDKLGENAVDFAIRDRKISIELE